MPYYLWKAVIGHTPRIPISKSEYERIVFAWNSIVAVIDIEEEWDNLIQNYIDLEMELLKSATHSMVLSHASYDEMHQRRLSFTRRLSNLLQTCRSYIDHAPHHLGKLKGYDFVASFDEVRRKAHAEHFSYRFMDAMRNYAQHRGVPLHGATYHSEWIEDDTGKKKSALRYVSTANVDLDKVRRDKRFSANVRAEIKELDYLDIATLTREYVEALGSIQNDLRDVMAEQLAEWKVKVRSAVQQYEAVNEGNSIGLAVAEFADENHVIGQVNIFNDLLLRQEGLARRNGSLINLRKRYVSNEILPARAKRVRSN